MYVIAKADTNRPDIVVINAFGAFNKMTAHTGLQS